MSCLWDAACEHRRVYRVERAQVQRTVRSPSSRLHEAWQLKGTSAPYLPAQDRSVVRGLAAG